MNSLKIRELRKNRGLTMKELGEVIGVAESTVSQYETGKRAPDFETLLKLGEFFGVSVDYILRGNPETEKDPAGSGEVSDDDIKFALFGGGPITDAQYDEVKKFAQYVKERDARDGK